MGELVSRKEDYARYDINHFSDEALTNAMKNIQNQMEEAVQQGESLTSEYMVQLSQQLDTYVLIAQIRKMRRANEKSLLFEV
ncbi:Spo0E family sporulation regulatory protein-aspartic acid phosphatase [Paenibacillus sp. MZ04-78.2]|uniref:Spo0E family sporulation regulatory protein-aspartic acid phosphatase n=1 Tax=Paenibacillus sp. MZ04-78.2 TaxID=2962034 RepID=UPI0020B7ACEC|nr:Spo0E family sporulation regulatory protein-aspartic acid phosphatase [Paenibacillus sp. MZ04-78.2]MCP3776639.1 Spo0E family sporulation regulatory protein-aspartic acid phosphatase [Paenibacillus sp. MZ04-78.2]